MTHDQDDDPRDYFHEDDEPVVPLPAVAGGSTALDGPLEVDVPDDREEPIWPWLPEIVAVAAILAVLFAAFVVFTRPSEVDNIVAPAASTSSTITLVTTTSTSLDTTTTAPPATTSTIPPATATTIPPAPAAPGTATGVLQTCRRAEGGVAATVAVTHQSGGPAAFDVRVGLFDPPNQMFAQGEGRSATVDPGATVMVDVLVAVAGTPRGACEVLGVEPA